jgi:1-acylglycerone phosphate reductase
MLLSFKTPPSSTSILQLTMPPRSVTVTTIITGGVQSRIARTVRSLPATSLYHPLSTEYSRRLTHSQEGAMPNEAYARSVVTQVLYGSPPWRWLWPWSRRLGSGRQRWIWEGNKAYVIWFLVGGWTWRGLFDRVLARMFQLGKLRRSC